MVTLKSIGLAIAFGVLLGLVKLAESGDIITDFNYAEDRYDTRIRSASLGYEHQIKKHNLGVYFRRINITETDNQVDLSNLNLMYNRNWKDSYFNMDVTNYRNKDFDFYGGSAGTGKVFNTKHRIDVSYSQGFMDSILGIIENVSFRQYDISTDYKPVAVITLVGGYTYKTISDTNVKKNISGRVTWDYNEHWQYESAYNSFTHTFWNPAYWSPDRFNQLVIGARFKIDINSWESRTHGFIGGQKEDNETSHYVEVGTSIGGWVIDDVWMDFYLDHFQTQTYYRSSIGLRLDFVLE